MNTWDINDVLHTGDDAGNEEATDAATAAALAGKGALASDRPLQREESRMSGGFDDQIGSARNSARTSARESSRGSISE